MDKPERFSYLIAQYYSFRRYFVLLVLFISPLFSHTQSIERLTYSFRFGWIPLGSAEFLTIDSVDRTYLKCVVNGVGIFGLLHPLDACMESWLTDAGASIRTYRDFQFGSQLDVRWNWFDYADSVRVKAYVEDINAHRRHAFDRRYSVYDLLGAIHNLRQMPMASDSLMLRVFYSNDAYTLKVRSLGIESLKTEKSNLRTGTYTIEIVDSDYFGSERKIIAYASTDRPRTVHKVIVEMLLGDFVFELDGVAHE